MVVEYHTSVGRLLGGLSWSHTRSRIHSRCKREFYFEYFRWDEPWTERASILKNLTTPLQAVGWVVDQVLKRAMIKLRDDGEIETDLAGKARTATRRVLSDSPDIVAKMRKGVPPGRLAQSLQCDYYGFPLSPADLDRCLERAEACGRAASKSDFFHRLSELKPTNWGPLPLPEDEELPPRFALTSDIDVWVAIDFYARVSGRCYILDWKTGAASERSQDEASLQLGVYALYAHHALGYPMEKILVSPVWLLEDASPRWGPVHQEWIERAREVILTETDSVRSVVEEVGEYKGRAVFEASSEAFPPMPQRNKCAGCRFLELCPEGRFAVPGTASVPG